MRSEQHTLIRLVVADDESFGRGMTCGRSYGCDHRLKHAGHDLGFRICRCWRMSDQRSSGNGIVGMELVSVSRTDGVRLLQV
jgi:hypothetical protein